MTCGSKAAQATLAHEADEVWDASSCSSDGSDNEGDGSVAVLKKPTMPKKPPLAPCPRVPQLPASCARPPVPAMARSVPLGQPGASTAKQGILTLISNLRSDNERLKEALAEAHREAEAMAQKLDQAGPAEGVDFAHLLSLVKDFGDDLGGGWDTSCPDGAALLEACSAYEYEHVHDSPCPQAMSMCTPRPRAPLLDCEVVATADEATEAGALRGELEKARREIEELRAELSLRGPCAACAGRPAISVR